MLSLAFQFRNLSDFPKVIQMQRIPEPELMTDDAQCQAYASADFSVSNQAFVDIVRNLIPEHVVNVLDLGCGPGDVMIRLARACPSLKIIAVDGSPAMIQLAQTAIEECGLSMAISALQGYVPGLPLLVGHFDAVLSKDFLHHLPDPMGAVARSAETHQAGRFHLRDGSASSGFPSSCAKDRGCCHL